MLLHCSNKGRTPDFRFFRQIVNQLTCKVNWTQNLDELKSNSTKSGLLKKLGIWGPALSNFLSPAVLTLLKICCLIHSNFPSSTAMKSSHWDLMDLPSQKKQIFFQWNAGLGWKARGRSWNTGSSTEMQSICFWPVRMLRQVWRLHP